MRKRFVSFMLVLSLVMLTSVAPAAEAITNCPTRSYAPSNFILNSWWTDYLRVIGNLSPNSNFIPTKALPTLPKPALPTQPAPAQPAPTQPVPIIPVPAKPVPTTPVPAQPVPTQPAPTQPAPVKPVPTQPAPAQPAPTQPAPVQPTPIQGLSADEQKMFDLVNQERVKAGVKPLQIDMTLVKLARMKSQDMIDNNYFAHQSPTYGSPFDMMRNYGVNFRTAGENLAGAPTVERAHSGLMNSEGHRRNILNPNFTHIGIGVVDGGPYGKMFTQMFIGK